MGATNNRAKKRPISSIYLGEREIFYCPKPKKPLKNKGLFEI